MMALMFRWTHKLKVTKSIVLPIMIFMVDNLILFYRSSKYFGNFKAVLKNVSSYIGHWVVFSSINYYISVCGNALATFPILRIFSKTIINFTQAFSRAILVFMNLKKVRFSMEWLFTNKAFNIKSSCFHNPYYAEAATI